MCPSSIKPLEALGKRTHVCEGCQTHKKYFVSYYYHFLFGKKNGNNNGNNSLLARLRVWWAFKFTLRGTFKCAHEKINKLIKI